MSDAARRAREARRAAKVARRRRRVSARNSFASEANETLRRMGLVRLDGRGHVAEMLDPGQEQTR